MSTTPTWQGPFAAASQYPQASILQALALAQMPPGIVTVDGLGPYLLPIPPGLFNWLDAGGSAANGALGVTYGVASFDFSGLAGMSILAGLALAGGPGSAYPACIAPVKLPRVVFPSDGIVAFNVTLIAFAARSGA